MKTVILIPTYNNATTVCGVVERSLAKHPHVLVVCDGCTDDTLERLAALNSKVGGLVDILSYEQNKGKGAALKAGFRKAVEMGYTHALTIDADGQHYPEDIPALLKMGQEQPDALIVGSRTFGDRNMPGSSRFANRFSNFWFAVETLQRLPDTQTGYRLYPLRRIGGLGVLTSRYEAELELLVFSSWRGTRLVPAPVRVFYPDPEERVTHFRPALDFTRISILNTVLCFLAVVYGWPRMLWHRLTH